MTVDGRSCLGLQHVTRPSQVFVGKQGKRVSGSEEAERERRREQGSGRRASGENKSVMSSGTMRAAEARVDRASESRHTTSLVHAVPFIMSRNGCWRLPSTRSQQMFHFRHLATVNESLRTTLRPTPSPIRSAHEARDGETGEREKSVEGAATA